MIESLIAKLGLNLIFGRMWTNAKADWARLSPNVHKWIFGILAALILGFIHQLYAHRQSAKHYHAGYVQAQADDAAKAKKIKDQLDAATKRIGQLEREKHDAEDRRISNAADALRLRGPGKAVCTQSPAAAGGHVESGGTGNAPLDRLPDPQRLDLIGLPFNDTIDFAKENDLCRSEELSWRHWYGELLKVWPKDGNEHH